jgi:hypothetical protein
MGNEVLARARTHSVRGFIFGRTDEATLLSCTQHLPTMWCWLTQLLSVFCDLKVLFKKYVCCQPQGASGEQCRGLRLHVKKCRAGVILTSLLPS